MKQSAYVLALFLGTSSAINFATGMNGDEDLGEDITMKGDKFHFVQQPGANGCRPGELQTAMGNCLFETNQIQMEAEPEAKAAAGTQASYPAPEKVHTLDPKIAKAHTTFYNQQKSLLQVDPDVRTAFYAQYDKQNGLWRVDDELLATQDNFVPSNIPQGIVIKEVKAHDVPQIHPYNYEPWVYKFSRDAMGPHSQHIDDDPEDSRPKSKEELSNTKEALEKKEKSEAEEKKIQDEKKEMKDAAEKETSKADAAKADGEALEKALKSADAKAELEKVAEKKEAKEEKKAELIQTSINNRFYNEQDGLWMYGDTSLVQKDEAKKEGEAKEAKKAAEAPVDEYGEEEKVAYLMPRRYQLRANTNQVNGVNVRRTTFYGQQNKEPNFVQLQGEPERSGQTTQYEEYGPAEKVQNLMPRRYERSANSNYVDGVRVSRTTYYTQLEDDVAGTPTEGVHILEPVAYKHAADTNLPFTRTTFY